jgi:hypothetical protein
MMPAPTPRTIVVKASRARNQSISELLALLSQFS